MLSKIVVEVKIKGNSNSPVQFKNALNNFDGDENDLIMFS